MKASPPPPPEVGLCARCTFARTQRNPRGNVFWRCGLADSDPRFRRYPALPVRTCAGFQPGASTPLEP